MIKPLLAAYITVALTLFFGLITYSVLIDHVLKPLVLSTFCPFAALQPQPEKHVAAEAICNGAYEISRAATTVTTVLTNLFHEASQGTMGGWFSRTEVINNGTASVEYHVETLKVTLLAVGGVALLTCLACVTAKCCHMSRTNSIRKSADAERAINMKALEKMESDHEKELTSIRNSINLQNAQLGSQSDILAATRIMSNAPGAPASDPKQFIYPNF